MSRRPLNAWRCHCGAAYLFEHPACPSCGGRLQPTRIADAARLLTHTTVRVNPTGSPYRIGVAATSCGATTLCVIDGDIRGTGYERVRLELRDGRYHAVAANARTRPGSRPSTRGDSPES